MVTPELDTEGRARFAPAEHVYEQVESTYETERIPQLEPEQFEAERADYEQTLTFLLGLDTLPRVFKTIWNLPVIKKPAWFNPAANFISSVGEIRSACLAVTQDKPFLFLVIRRYMKAIFNLTREPIAQGRVKQRVINTMPTEELMTFVKSMDVVRRLLEKHVRSTKPEYSKDLSPEEFAAIELCLLRANALVDLNDPELADYLSGMG